MVFTPLLYVVSNLTIKEFIFYLFFFEVRKNLSDCWKAILEIKDQSRARI